MRQQPHRTILPGLKGTEFSLFQPNFTSPEDRLASYFPFHSTGTDGLSPHFFLFFFFSPKIWKTYESLLTQGISFIECLGFNWPVQREPKGEEKNTSALHWLWVTWTPAALDFCWSFVCNWTVALSTYQLLGLSKRAVAEIFKRNVTAICGFFFVFFLRRETRATSFPSEMFSEDFAIHFCALSAADDKGHRRFAEFRFGWMELAKSGLTIFRTDEIDSSAD